MLKKRLQSPENSPEVKGIVFHKIDSEVAITQALALCSAKGFARLILGNVFSI